MVAQKGPPRTQNPTAHARQPGRFESKLNVASLARGDDAAEAEPSRTVGRSRLQDEGQAALRQQQLGDLHGVERGALADLVGHHPHSQAVLHRVVAAQAPDVGIVGAG